jgi:hypothetical protein
VDQSSRLIRGGKAEEGIRARFLAALGMTSVELTYIFEAKPGHACGKGRLK